MRHSDCVLFGAVVVDEHGRGIKGGGLQDLLLKHALSSLKQSDPVRRLRRNDETSVRTAALHVHRYGHTHTHTYRNISEFSRV